MSQPKSVGIWIRVSTEDQAKGESPEHHEKRARYYAESKGWTIGEVYHLEGVSGKAVMQHLETQRMLKDIKNDHISGLIFSKLARLARNTRELLDFADYFREHGADLISLGEAIDTTSPAGRFVYTMISAFAEFEREEISSRVAASVPIRAKLGKPLGGGAPFGYRWVDKKLVTDPKEVPIRKQMCELFLIHRRMRTVARLLNQAGHRTRNGSQFTGNTVERLIRDPIAKGKRRANYTKSLGDNKNWVIKPESEWVYSDIEPIVSEEIWNQCQQILIEQARPKKRPARPAVHLFTGLAICACGRIMRVPSNSPKYICKLCKNKIGETDLEELFAEQLRNFVFAPEEIANYFAQAGETIHEKEELIKQLTLEQKDISSELDRLVKLRLKEELDEHAFKRHYAPLDTRLNQIEERLPELQGEADFLRIQYFSSEELVEETKNLSERWPNLSSEEKRNIVETITDSITIGKDEVTIQLSHLPSPYQNDGTIAPRPQGLIHAYAAIRGGERVPRTS